MHGHYNAPLVTISFAIAILAAWVALDFSSRVEGHHRRTFRKGFWLVAGSLCMGTGIWSMHYVGMLAYQTDMPVLYDWPTVVLSLIAAIAASGVAFLTVTQRRLTSMRTFFSSLLMAAGISGMHYIGMAAMRMPHGMRFSPPLVALSVMVAMVISMVAIRLTFGLKSSRQLWSWQKAASALLMGLAIPSMHYIGMAAARWTSGPGRFGASDLRHAIAIGDLSTVMVVQGSILVLALALVVANWDRRVSHFETALDASGKSYAQLLSHHERLQAAFRAGGVGIWECNPSNGDLYLDPSMRELYGIDAPDGPVNRAVLKERVHPDDLEKLNTRWSQSLRSGDTYENEYRLLQAKGVERWVRTVASIVRSTDGQAIKVLGMSWDVTAERQRQKETTELAERFRKTLDSIGDAVIATDERRRVVFLNPVASQLTGWSAEQGIGRTLDEIFITRDEATDVLRSNPILRCIASGGTLLSEDGVLVSREGTRHNIRKHVALVNDAGAAVLTFQDITDSRRMERELKFAATHDALTGLVNRATFEGRLQTLWEESRNAKRNHCLCMVDLDRFKIINDTSGHLAGDALLREVAALLQRNLKPSDTPARMGGDEFLLILTDATRAEHEARVQKILFELAELRFPWQGRLYDVTASIGLVHIDEYAPTPEMLISQADVATFTAKRNGRNQVSIYAGQGSGPAGHHAEMQIVAELRRALEENRFELHAQPIVAIGRTAPTAKFELLLRMRDEQGELVSPGLFVPAAERYGLIRAVDRWVVREAALMYCELSAVERGVEFAVNLSAESLSDPTLWNFVEEQLRLHNIAPKAFTFEVTETALIGNFENARGFVQSAREAGCRIALDDFGTGLSSLSYLKSFALDTIKIDGSFVRMLKDDVLDQAIVRSIAEIARSMSASTIAECVEDIAMLRVLGDLGVDYVQGWATGKPLPLAEALSKALRAEHMSPGKEEASFLPEHAFAPLPPGMEQVAGSLG